MTNYEREVYYFGTPKSRAKIYLTVPIHDGTMPTKEMRINWLIRLIKERNGMIRDVRYWNEVLTELKNY